MSSSSSSSYLSCLECLALVLDLTKRFLMFLPVLFVAGIIAIDWWTFDAVYTVQRYEDSPAVAVFVALLFNSCVVLLSISYYRCIFTSSAVEDHMPAPLTTIMIVGEGGAREASNVDGAAPLTTVPQTCSKCGVHKPPRAHHCGVCGKCVLKMDHHCPWVANCVGYYNYKYFCLFLFYAALSCFVYVFGAADKIINSFSGTAASASGKHAPDESPLMGFLILFCSILTIAFGISLLFFVMFHLHLVWSAKTTLEYGFINENVPNPYDQGSKRKNFEQVFGSTPWIWLLPIPADTLQDSDSFYYDSVGGRFGGGFPFQSLVDSSSAHNGGSTTRLISSSASAGTANGVGSSGSRTHASASGRASNMESTSKADARIKGAAGVGSTKTLPQSKNKKPRGDSLSEDNDDELMNELEQQIEINEKHDDDDTEEEDQDQRSRTHSDV